MDLPNFWQTLAFSPSLKLQHPLILPLADNYSDFLSEYTAHIQLLLAGIIEEQTWHHLVAPRICCST
jgi:hypothetical protein